VRAFADSFDKLIAELRKKRDAVLAKTAACVAE
jgi:hypothetical protein